MVSLKCCFQSLPSCWKAQSLAFFSSYRQKVNNWDYLTKTTFRKGLFLSSLLSSSASSSSPSSAVAVSGRRLWKIKSCRRPVDCKKPRDGVETVGDTRYPEIPCQLFVRSSRDNPSEWLLQELLQLWSSRSLHSSCYLVAPQIILSFLILGFWDFMLTGFYIKWCIILESYERLVVNKENRWYPLLPKKGLFHLHSHLLNIIIYWFFDEIKYL